MSKIDDLIKELCPDGVRFVRVGDVAVIGTGRSDRKDAVENGQYPFYVRSKIVSRIDRYSFDEEAIIIPGEGGVGDIFHYVNGKYDLHQRAYRIVFTTDEVNTKYALYYFMSHFKSFITLKAVNATVTSIRKPMIEDFRIPVPPLEVQKEIVRVLDSFTELEAELEARKKQYEYYRNTLLTFNERERVIWKSMGEIGKISMCKRIMKSQTSRSGDIPFYKIGTFGKTADAYISRELYSDYKSNFPFPKKGDILLSASGTIGRTVVYDGKPAYFQDSNIIWLENDESQVTNKFLYHLYKITTWQTEGGTIKRLYIDNFKRVKIPVLPLEKQKQIVSILDKFDALVNDISTGLPAEIEARRKQYEYYRNKLLTFKELECSR